MNGENRKEEDMVGSSRPGPEQHGESPVSLRQRIQKGPVAVVVALLCIFAGALSGYVIVMSLSGNGGPAVAVKDGMELDPSNALTLNMFYPIEGKVALEKRLVPKVEGTREIAAAAVREFLAGPEGGMPSYVPEAVDLTDAYLGSDGVLYLDFTSAMTLNFQGDAVAEYLLLRSLYRTLRENTSGVKGYRLLVDGREVDTIGGHLFVLGGLDRAVPYRLLEEDEIE